ncbi:MAG TPA: cell division protein ZapE [Xanthomonadales bacterium]|nr:cell division protein ZapE [Xanthomonadales bacterium]
MSAGADDTPSARYAAGIAAGAWQDDPAQRALLPSLDRIARQIAKPRARGLIDRLRGAPRHAARGLYVWGGVGRGKTFLIDLLHDCVPEPLRQRLHFHRFMGRVHAELAAIRDEADPLARVAASFARTPLLCLDEFFVQDIGDAMILAQLLKHFGHAGGTLVTTSNIAPRELYRDGLQRAKFVPAIQWLERHCEVALLDSPHDYRLRALTQAPVYQTPLGEAAEAELARIFARVAPGSLRPEASTTVNGRPIALKRRADGVAWFEFAALCEGPRAVADYIELAKSYNTVLVSNVPQFDAGNDDPARRFVHLVDEFYDRNVNLVLSAAVPVEELYRGERLAREFERTRSRLIEMRSTEYLAREHRP